MEVVVLGTSSAVPTKERNHSAYLLKYEGYSFLFDCGEGTQRQMRLAGESPMKVDNIFITHWHGDHVLGIPGLLLSMGLNNRKDPIHIWGPVGSKKRLEYLMQGFSVRIPCSIVVHELNPKTKSKVFESDRFEIWTTKLKHSIVSLGYYFKEKDKLRLHKDKVMKLGLQGNPLLNDLQEGKDVMYEKKKLKSKDMTYTQTGKKVTIILDTEAIPKIATFAADSDLFICESTFSNKEKDKAKERLHMTTKQAAKLAKDAKVKQLVITHFSQRYKETDELEKEAKSVFKNTVVAKDFMRFTI